MHSELLGGRFQIEREIGRGAAGIVYRAHDLVTQGYVALKVIVTRGTEPEEEARFEREGRILAELNHPGIVRVIAFGTLDGEAPFLAMEWLEGEDLATLVAREPPSLRQSLEILRQVALSLDAAHRAGIIHRDIKPTNIFLLATTERSQPFVKLVDFGVAAAGDVRLTHRGSVVGTPAYMAPEQARGDAPVDARADLYSLGATLFELVAGRPPHVGPTPIATLARLVTTPAPRLSEIVPEVTPALDDLVARLLATSPDARPDSAALVAVALSELLADEANHTLRTHGALEEGVPISVSDGSGSRLMTSLVALFGAAEQARTRAFSYLREHGAEAVALGHSGIVAHLGARQTLGDEAARALDLGTHLAHLGARVGVATGRTRVVITRPMGDVVDRAAAFAREALLGQVIADATTTELARGRYEIQQRDDGAAVVGNAVTQRTDALGGAPFVGREPELAHVLSTYERCLAHSSPVVVSCTGPPGIGKTRLSREVLARLAAFATPPRLIVARCESFGRSHPLGTAAELLRNFLGVGKGASPEAALQGLEQYPGTSAHDSGNQGRELVARLVANRPLPQEQGARDSLWLAMTDMVVHTASTTPVGLVFEDAQWSDPESMAWVDHVLGRAEHKPLWVLVLARNLFWESYPRAFVERDHVRLELRPISKRATREIAQAVLAERATEELLEAIATQAAGSPLFAEELARLAAAGRDAAQAPTIEAAIQASLDTLDPSLRDALERFSTFGMAGWEAGLAALGVPDTAAVLRKLSAAELLIEQASSRFESSREWSFKHALVREVAYASLAPESKRRLHATAALWLETMGEDEATVARHYELGAQAKRAADHWERAARRALATNALTDAVSMAERALAYAIDAPTAFARALLLDEAFSRLDSRAADRETAIYALAENIYDEASQVRAAGARARYDDARGAGADIAERLAEVRSRSAELGLTDEEARCGAALAARYAFAGKLPEAELEASHLLTLAERKGVAAAAVDAWQTLAIVRQTRGELISALDARWNAARAAASAGLKEREATLTINVGFALTTMGAKQEARTAIEQGLALAQAIGSPGTVRLGKMVLLGWSATFGTDGTLETLLAEPRSEADAAAGGRWVAPDRVTLGVLFYRGIELLRSEGDGIAFRARTLLKTATEVYRATDMRDLLPVALGVWAEAERRCGDGPRALALATEAAKLVEQGAPSLLNETPIYLTLHDIYLEQGELQQAKTVIGRAIQPLMKRLSELRGSNYALSFLIHLPNNAALLAAAEAYGLLPQEVQSLLQDAAVLHTTHAKSHDALRSQYMRRHLVIYAGGLLTVDRVGTTPCETTQHLWITRMQKNRGQLGSR